MTFTRSGILVGLVPSALVPSTLFLWALLLWTGTAHAQPATTELAPESSDAWPGVLSITECDARVDSLCTRGTPGAVVQNLGGLALLGGIATLIADRGVDDAIVATCGDPDLGRDAQRVSINAACPTQSGDHGLYGDVDGARLLDRTQPRTARRRTRCSTAPPPSAGWRACSWDGGTPRRSRRRSATPSSSPRR